MCPCRKPLLVLSLTLTISLIGLRLRALWVTDHLVHTVTTVSRDPAVPEGSLGAWVIRVRTDSASDARGTLRFTRSVFESLQDSAPAGRVTDSFAAQDGWRMNHSDSGRISADTVGPVFFNSPSDWRCLGFGCYPSASGASLHHTVEVPVWFLALIAATPALAIGRGSLRRSRRLRRGQCPRCGYNTAGAMLVCPECGGDVPPSRRAHT
jgi:hypothetical protein